MDLFKNLVLDKRIKKILLFPLILKEQFRILIIGDPSTGKTDILNSLLKNAYRAQLINSNFEYHMNYFSKPN